MSIFNLHPVDLGDLPAEVRLNAWGHLLPIDQSGIQKNWRSRYAEFIRSVDGALWIDIKAADCWLDQRGKAIFSELALKEKMRRNPGWIPARDRLNGALDGLPVQIMRELAGLLEHVKLLSSTQEVSCG